MNGTLAILLFCLTAWCLFIGGLFLFSYLGRLIGRGWRRLTKRP
jgi:hypothetical protein